MRALDLLFLRFIPPTEGGGKAWELTQLRDVRTAFTWDIPGLICAGEDGLNRYINDPWLALTDTVMPGP